MAVPIVIWDLEDDPEGNVQHIAEHDVAPNEVEEVLAARDSVMSLSRSTGERVSFGYTARGRYLAVVWEHVLDEPLMVRPITAYEVPEPRTRRRR